MSLLARHGAHKINTELRLPGVPEKENRRFETAAIPSAKLGLPTTFQSELQGPGVMGAEAGRSITPTAIVTMITRHSVSSLHSVSSVLKKGILAMRIHGSPIHASQVIRPRVRMLLNANPIIAATAAKTAVHVA